MTTAAGLTFI